MDRQGNRIRFTRLTIVLPILLVVVLLSVVGLQRWWKEVTTGDVVSDSQDPSCLAPPTERETNPPEGIATSAIRSTTETPESVSSEWHPLDDVLELARNALILHRENHRDYTATLVKTERIKSTLLPTTKMSMKLRYRELQPGNGIRGVDVYFRFLEPKNQAGREVIYAPERYDGLIKAHEGGFLGMITVALSPNSQMAMRGNRHPITEVGLEKLITKLIEKGERDRFRGDCIVNRIPGEQIDNRDCELIEVIHPEKTYQQGDATFEHEFYKAQVWFDTENLVPLKYSSYQWAESPDGEPLLEEEYTYLDLKFNVGLSDDDFDTENKAYRFP